MALLSNHIQHVMWSDLPNDLWELIFKELRHAGDLVRFGAVCKSWNTVAMSAKERLLLPLSPLLLMPGKENFEDCKLFDFSECNAYKFQIPSIRNQWICNSYNGWFVTINCIPTPNTKPPVRQRGSIVLCDIGPEPKVIEFAPPVRNGGCLKHKYLVELSGDFLLILRNVDWEDCDRADETDETYGYKTLNFEVFKLDFSKKEWHEVKSLGNDSLFVGHGSTTISTEEFPEFRGDCIYFVDDDMEGYFERPHRGYDIGVFNLKNGQFEPMLQFPHL